MKKLLYITDQDEYVDHSFIAPLFEVYLKKYMDIDIVYFSDFKTDFERKDAHRFTVPSCNKEGLLDELKRNDVPLATYDFVMVRNNISLMQHVLEHKVSYNYKALFRFSFPKRSVKINCDQAEKKNTLFAPIINHFKTKQETEIINQCDAFLPTSRAMHKIFRPNVTIPTILCAPAINPAMLCENKQHDSDEKRFIYQGTLDKARKFETVLDAFAKVKSKKWKLYISTRDTDYAQEMVDSYPKIQENIEIYPTKTKHALLELIAKADIGVAIFPNISVYNSSTPVKIYDYYSSKVPCIMTRSEHTSTIFTDNHDAWFCGFGKNRIRRKLEYLLTLSKEEVALVGSKGQQRLLDIKNYETIAQDIASQLEAL